MIPKKIQEAFNKQINEELYSAYLYQAMSVDFAAKGMSGMANWMAVQALEEMSHAKKFQDHILERGGTVELLAIEKPQKAWETPRAAFEAALAHEQHITGCINDLVDLGIAEKDHASKSLLQWFVDEQVEEEDTANENIDKLAMIGKSSGALYMFDKELGGRTFTPPAANEE